MHVVTEHEIRAAVTEQHALEAAELAFRALGEGAVTVATPVGLRIHEHSGELHVKCAHLHGSRFFVVKAATGFYENAQHGLPTGSGLMMLFDATTGFPLGLLQDNGYLTELRTAGAAALAARVLSLRPFETVALIGAGSQARYQLRAFQHSFRWPLTRIWSRTKERTQQLCDEMRKEVSCEFAVTESAEEAVRGADVIITVTPSTVPLVRGEWLEDHATVIAVGSDEVEKRELDDGVFERADRIVVDSVAQCATLGELHHALENGIVSLTDCTELGEIIAGNKIGRIGRELIVCDLTGVGAQDAAVAELAYRRVTMIGDAVAHE